MTDPPAPTIPGLSFVGKLGAGGYADVYLYEQAMPARRVAVKVLRDSDLGRGVVQRFRSEANAMALLEHPHIVPVYATGSTADGRPFLVMMHYPRASLAERVKRERLGVPEALRIGIQLASAVETAHRAGLLHRDIKPANVLTSQYGTPGLTDFGIAADVADADDSDAGVSVPWSPPEVLYVTAPASARSDVYSLAATLWHLLVGRSPFELPGRDNSHYALMKRIRDQPVPETGRPDVPPSLERLLKAGMAKDPGLRPATAMDFARSLQVIEQELRLPRTEIVVAEDLAAPRDREAGGDETRMQGPQLLAAQTPVSGRTPPTEDLRTRRRTPEVRGVNAPEDATVHRVASSLEHPELDDADTPSGGRVLPWVAAVIVLALLGGGLWLLTGGQRPQARPTATQTLSEPPPDPGNTVPPPGRPQITGTRDGTDVTFRWTYANPLASDQFYYLLRLGQRPRTLSEPLLKLTGQPEGTRVCIWVRVHRASGQDASRTYEKGVCAMSTLTVDFCGELYQRQAGESLTLGREADVVVDDENPFLHRVFLMVSERQGLWWLTNVGSQLTATVSDGQGGLQAWLAPGGALPVVFAHTVVWFTAGSTTYEFDIFLDDSSYEPVEAVPAVDGTVTIGRVQLTPDQKLLIIALCENVLRRGDRGAGHVPQSGAAAQRLGWTITKFNRKLDNVCEKLADLGVRGLRGGPTKLASSRKARLVEYAMAARIVTVEDLDLLP